MALSRLVCLIPFCAFAQTPLTVAGLEKPVDILRDKWGVPHIYAQSQHDVFFAQGYITAKDRLFQLDLWRRQGAGQLAEVLGPQHVGRDRIARLVRYRGDWDAEWKIYSPDTKAIATAFTDGINAYIKSLNGKRPVEFQAAGWDPGLWKPEDVTSRIAGLLMCRNLAREVQRAIDIRTHGAAKIEDLLPPDPFVKLEIPRGLDLSSIHPGILRDYTDATVSPRLADLNSQGSNNWVVDGTLSVTGKPLLASDPHRPVTLPSLRKTVHLVAPGLNVIGAGEPALPGIALGHNEQVGFGFTIVGTDQQDLYVEKLNPANPLEYRYQNAWKRMEVETTSIAVKGGAPRKVDLKYTIHGPVLFEDPQRNLAFSLRWVGTEAGGAGYLAALGLMRSRNWKEFLSAASRYKVPSENLIYADAAGNIGWVAAGWAPIRKNWSGLTPVPGDSGEYEWQGYLPITAHPQKYNPREHYLATANANILPDRYPHMLAYEWAQPFRFERVVEMLRSKPKFSLADFAAMQGDVTSLPARRLQQLITRAKLQADWARRIARWDARLATDSAEALVAEVWMAKLGIAAFGEEFGRRVEMTRLFRELDSSPRINAILDESLRATLAEIERALGPDASRWRWGAIHTIQFRHPLGRPEWSRGPYPRPGSANTVNATSGARFEQNAGASFRMVLDPSNWDNSVMTNVPGESADPASPFYANLIEDWLATRHHPLPYSRAAVEAATVERIRLTP
jgi:penicillin amidase